MRHRRKSSTPGRAASAALICWLACGLVGGQPTAALGWSEFGLAEDPALVRADGPEIQEPFFDFLLGLVAADSTGHWSGRQLRAHATALGRESRFPLDELVSVSRERPDSTAVAGYPGVPVAAVWRITLTGPQDRPMPYSILGYHPGSLRLAGELVLIELAPGDLDLTLRQGDDIVHRTVTGVRVFALAEGYVVLDADGWLDALLGAGLDDAWTLGFVTGREEGRLLGLGVSVGRKGRQIYGEFDFADDEVLAHGRPLVSALSRRSRAWLNTGAGNLPPPWIEP